MHLTIQNAEKYLGKTLYSNKQRFHYYPLKEGAVGKYTFECHADLTSDLDKLPWHIYYPKASEI